MKLPYIKIEQPIGTFYLTNIPAQSLIEMVTVSQRSADNIEGIQRERSRKRIAEISEFCKDSDAVFPTPIVVSVNLDVPYSVDPQSHTIDLPEGRVIGQVIDGQHRLWGIKDSGLSDIFELPVVLMFDLTVEEKAYIFTIINSTQTKVNKSLIYDLFALSTTRSPQRTSHEIARALNSSEDSPFFGRMKMLGKKDLGQKNAVLSQGTFVKQMLQLISKNPEEDARAIKIGRPLVDDLRLPLRKFFIKEQDDVIYKVLLNTFNALKSNFQSEWLQPETNILWKTTGFCGIMSALNYIMRYGVSEKTLTYEFFDRIFAGFKQFIEEQGISLTSKDFPGGGQQNQRKFANLLVASIDKKYAPQIIDNKNLDRDYKRFIQSIISDLNIEEKYELAEAISGVSFKLNSFEVYDDKANEKIIITYPYADLTLELKKTDINDCLKWMEDTYFGGMTFETWYSVEKSLEKDD